MNSQADDNKRTRRLTCVGFEWRAEVSLKETLALLRGKTSDHWQYSDEITADVVVYDPRNALARALVQREDGPNARQVFFTCGGDEDGELVLRHPFGASRLIRCLDHASQRLAGAVGNAASETGSLCQRLDDALHTPGVRAVAISANGQTGLLKPAEQTLHWPQPMSLDETAKLLSGNVGLQVLGAGDEATIARVESRASSVSPAEGLLWAIGIARSKGTLLNRIDPIRAYRLRRWPNFGVIGRRSADLRCASLMIQRELSHGSLAMMSTIPASIVVNFMNASALCGLLVEARRDAVATLAAPVALPASAADSRFGGMLRRIRQAFALDNP